MIRRLEQIPEKIEEIKQKKAFVFRVPVKGLIFKILKNEWIEVHFVVKNTPQILYLKAQDRVHHFKYFQQIINSVVEEIQ